MKILLSRGLFGLTLMLCFFSAAFAQKNNPIVQKTSTAKATDAHVSSAMEVAVLDELNTVRSDPQKYIAYLEDYKKLFKEKTVFLPGFLRIETIEGKAPVEEAIEYLKTLPKLKPLALSNSLNKAAVTQLKDLIADSSIGHTGKDGSDLTTRLKRFGMVGYDYAENIAYFVDTARDIVLAMIIDDGVKSRSHRKNVFSPNFRLIGIAFGKGKSDEGLCVADFADSFMETTQKSAGGNGGGKRVQ